MKSKHVNIARQQLKVWHAGDSEELAALAEKGMEFRAPHAPTSSPRRPCLICPLERGKAPSG